MRPDLEVADIFRSAGPAYRADHAGHLSLAQLKVMTAIENCRTAALGGHVEACEDCGHWRVAYNSCRNRHCPKCQGAAARAWLAEREADLLPVGYFHVVFTLPAEIAAIAFHNKAALYDLLFRTASETMLTIAADPKHLGARIGITAVLHTWGSAMTYHPHVHMIVPGGGIALDGTRWIASRPAFLLPVRVLGKLFRRLFLTRLVQLHDAGRLAFFGSLAPLADRQVFLEHLAPARKARWVVYAKPPFAGPQAVLAYLSRYTHRVAISNRRLLAFDETGVTFRYKDYRRDAPERQQAMTLATDEFIRRFLLHVLPRGFHRIRHYGLLAGASRKDNLAQARRLLAVPPPMANALDEPNDVRPPCPCCGGRMIVIETFARWRQPRAPPPHAAIARMIGKYDSVVAFGQKRALVVWQRLILPDGSSARLDNMPATDPSGYAGLADKVDFHTWTLLKGVAVATLLGVGSELSIAGESDLVQAIRESAQSNMARAGDQITQRNLDIQPTITIRPGALVRVLITRDLILAPWRG